MRYLKVTMDVNNVFVSIINYVRARLMYYGKIVVNMFTSPVRILLCSPYIVWYTISIIYNIIKHRKILMYIVRRFKFLETEICRCVYEPHRDRQLLVDHILTTLWILDRHDDICISSLKTADKQLKKVILKNAFKTWVRETKLRKEAKRNILEFGLRPTHVFATHAKKRFDQKKYLHKI